MVYQERHGDGYGRTIYDLPRQDICAAAGGIGGAGTHRQLGRRHKNCDD